MRDVEWAVLLAVSVLLVWQAAFAVLVIWLD